MPFYFIVWLIVTNKMQCFCRKNVQQVKGAWSLLTALQTMSSNDFHIPVAITLASQPSVSDASPKVKVQITDVMGGDLGAMDVQVDSGELKLEISKIILKLWLNLSVRVLKNFLSLKS